MRKEEPQTEELAGLVAKLVGELLTNEKIIGSIADKVADRVKSTCTCGGHVDLAKVWGDQLREANLELMAPLTVERAVELYPLAKHEIEAVVQNAQERGVKGEINEEQLKQFVLEYLGDKTLQDRLAMLKQGIEQGVIFRPEPCHVHPFTCSYFKHNILCGTYSHECSRPFAACPSLFVCSYWEHHCRTNAFTCGSIRYDICHPNLFHPQCTYSHGIPCPPSIQPPDRDIPPVDPAVEEMSWLKQNLSHITQHGR